MNNYESDATPLSSHNPSCNKGSITLDCLNVMVIDDSKAIGRILETLLKKESPLVKMNDWEPPGTNALAQGVKTRRYILENNKKAWP